MKHIMTILRKQLKDTLKNKTVLIQFILFPLLGIILTRTVRLENMPENFFVNLFATMYIGMAPLTCVSAIIAEEKEQNTLRVLMMADVSPVQYLIGIASYVFAACMLGEVVFCCLLDGVTSAQRMLFLLISAVGIIASVMLGAAIGVGCKNQMAATSVAMPVMLVFSFLPMLSMFHDGIAKVAKITYSEQIRILLSNVRDITDPLQNVVVILLNVVLFGILFGVLYKRRGLV